MRDDETRREVVYPVFCCLSRVSGLSFENGVVELDSLKISCRPGPKLIKK